MRRHRERLRTRLVIVDYVQLVRRNPRLDENAALDEIVTASAAAAKDDDGAIAWLVLSQLNWKVEERADKRPLLSDLRGSGALEERAKVAVGLYRGAYYHAGPQKEVDCHDWAEALVQAAAFAHVRAAPICRGYTTWSSGRAGCGCCGWGMSGRTADGGTLGSARFAQAALARVGQAIALAVGEAVQALFEAVLPC